MPAQLLEPVHPSMEEEEEKKEVGVVTGTGCCCAKSCQSVTSTWCSKSIRILDVHI